MSLQNLLTIEFKSKKIKIEKQEYLVKELSNREFKTYQKKLFTIENGIKKWHTENVKSALVVACLYDIDNNKIFKNKADEILMENIPQRIIDAIYEEAEKINGLDETVDDKVKN